MKALVTGHRGFVGRHMWAVLEQRGYDLTGVDIADGVDVRDFFRADTTRYDLVVHLAAVDQDVPGPTNLCTGRGVSFNELAAMVTLAACYTPRFDHKRDAPRGVAYRVGDPAKMLGFYTPRVSLEEGIVRALALKAAT